MLRGQISIYLPPEHTIIAIGNNGIQKAEVSVDRCIDDVKFAMPANEA